MKERPIPFSGEMVRAILDGRKTQTRRIVKPQPSVYVPGPNVHKPKHPAEYFDSYCNAKKTEANPRGMSEFWCWWTPDDRQGPDWIRCPYGVPGDRLWVRETWTLANKENVFAENPMRAWRPWFGNDALVIIFRADNPDRTSILNDRGEPLCWAPSIHMHRKSSRITLEITSVRVERLQEISEADAKAEGFKPSGEWDAIDHFILLWDAINGKRASWESNPWVWVVEFKLIAPPKGGRK